MQEDDYHQQMRSRRAYTPRPGTNWRQPDAGTLVGDHEPLSTGVAWHATHEDQVGIHR